MSAIPIDISHPPAISPLIEMGAYEALWWKPSATFKTIADLFREKPGSIPSDFVPYNEAASFATKALRLLERKGMDDFGVRVHGAGEYPDQLRDASHPVEVLYYRGWWNLTETPSVAVVGTRKPTESGKRRTAKVVKELVRDGFTIVSGLARGVDTVALTTAMEEGGTVIAVIGTPIGDYYPPENRRLQDAIAGKFLLISQVPIVRYSVQNPNQNRLFFPERNVTMSALTSATVIVEAGESSGTLTQARAAIKQGRRLFILDSCFQDPLLTWPARFEKLGAIRVRTYDDIRQHLAT